MASSASFLVSLAFVAVLVCVSVSWLIYSFPYHLFSDEVYNVVIVNAPDSFIKFNEDTQPFRDQKASEYGDPDDLFGNWQNILSFKYNYDGYGKTKFIYKETKRNPAIIPVIIISRLST